ncbi:hypothetical protein DFP73DRAFT_624424 [Morchella snyderi]|nr:hypothetical protein DFP73DRAFT_624424 [Morchella snyderi]
MDEKSLKKNIRQMETTIREITEKIKLKTKWINVPKEPEIEPIEEMKAKEEEAMEIMIEEQERMDRMKSERDDTNAELIESMEEDLLYLEGEDAQDYINHALNSGVPEEYIKENLYRPIGLDAVTHESGRSEETTRFNNDIKPGGHTAFIRKSLDTSSSNIIREHKQLPPPKKIEIVVAHHHEALEWLGPFLSHPGVKISIYSKGGKKLSPIFHAHTQYLRDNVGHGVGHTYLYHIVARYDTLQDVTVFCKGDISERFDYRPERFLVEALNTRDQAPVFFEGQEAEEIDLFDRTDSEEFALGARFSVTSNKVKQHPKANILLVTVGANAQSALPCDRADRRFKSNDQHDLYAIIVYNDRTYDDDRPCGRGGSNGDRSNMMHLRVIFYSRTVIEISFSIFSI